MKMQINIWSDVRCPFCYIGKKKFETALEKFPQKDKVEVVWHSFQLDPDLKTQPDSSTLEYFVKTKGVSEEQTKQMLGHATQMAKEVGLEFNIEESILANSLNAHRLIQFAKTKGLGNEIEEVLFKAHFTEKKNIDDLETLVNIGVSIGLDEKETKEMLASDDFAYEVKQDEMQAKNIGVTGVPFFVFNNKYAVSGAQTPEAFLETLEKSWEEYEKENPSLIVTKGDSCDVDGNCN
ncbi:MAG TPA: DsbA family oxidoreductase [Flavobacteriaceae bacterium]|nr:DsbA family oxidoreductase [Flavobacteriaceae bacterium]